MSLRKGAPAAAREALVLFSPSHDGPEHTAIEQKWEGDGALSSGVITCACGRGVMVERRDCLALGTTVYEVEVALRNVTGSRLGRRSS